MSVSQQLKRGKQLHNGSNLSEITRSQSPIIITLGTGQCWTQREDSPDINSIAMVKLFRESRLASLNTIQYTYR